METSSRCTELSKYVMYTYKNGMFEGVQETYYENGSVKSECAYKNGEVKGKVKEYKKEFIIKNS